MDANGFLQLSSSKFNHPPFQFLSIPDQDETPLRFLEIKERAACNHFLSLDQDSENIQKDDGRDVFKRKERQSRRVDRSNEDEIIAQKEKLEDSGDIVEVKRVTNDKRVVESSIQTSPVRTAKKLYQLDIAVPIQSLKTDSSVQTEEQVSEIRRFQETKDPFHEVTWISRANELKLQGYRSLILNDNPVLLKMAEKSLSALSFQL